MIGPIKLTAERDIDPGEMISKNPITGCAVPYDLSYPNPIGVATDHILDGEEFDLPGPKAEVTGVVYRHPELKKREDDFLKKRQNLERELVDLQRSIYRRIEDLNRDYKVELAALQAEHPEWFEKKPGQSDYPSKDSNG